MNNHKTYLAIAEAYAVNSRAKRKKVGACLVTEQGVVLGGYNGTPCGADNILEYLDEKAYTETGDYVASLVTKKDVIHAELNCILKAAREGVSIKGSVLYTTLSPCLPCAAMLVQAGVREVYYKEKYRDTCGIDYLNKYNVECSQYPTPVDLKEYVSLYDNDNINNLLDIKDNTILDIKEDNLCSNIEDNTDVEKFPFWTEYITGNKLGLFIR